MPGPKPKPTHLKLIEGNPGKRKLPENEPKPEIRAPECPEHLDRVARKEWNRIVPQLVRLQLLSEVDMVTLAGYCQLYSRWVKIEKAIAAKTERIEKAALAIDKDVPEGALITIDTAGNARQSPLVIMARQTLQLIRSYCAEFGFSPAARARISVPGAPETEDDILD